MTETLSTSPTLKVFPLHLVMCNIINIRAVQASLQSNTYVVSGNCETKAFQDLLPGILSQMGPESMEALRAMMSSMGADPAAAAAAGGADDDDDIPDLVENFEDTANK